MVYQNKQIQGAVDKVDTAHLSFRGFCATVAIAVKEGIADVVLKKLRGTRDMLQTDFHRACEAKGLQLVQQYEDLLRRSGEQIGGFALALDFGAKALHALLYIRMLYGSEMALADKVRVAAIAEAVKALYLVRDPHGSYEDTVDLYNRFERTVDIQLRTGVFRKELVQHALAVLEAITTRREITNDEPFGAAALGSAMRTLLVITPLSDYDKMLDEAVNGDLGEV